MHDELREAREVPVVARLANREHDRDRLGQQPPRDERERLRGHAIEPLRVVDEAHQRPVLGCVRQQAEDSQPDQESIGRLALDQPERGPQRVGLRARESLQPVEQRGAELVQAGERELHLGLDADGPSDLAVRSRVQQIRQQRGLADARLASHDEDAALPGTDALQEPIQHLTLAAPPTQLRPRIVHRRRA